MEVPRTSQHGLRSAQNEKAQTPFPKVSINDVQNNLRSQQLLVISASIDPVSGNSGTKYPFCLA